jgi:O-antigen ligase
MLKISNKKKSLILLLLATGFSSLIYFTPSAKIRFTEIINEYNRPLVGLYTSSTSIRLAILNCSINLASDNYLVGMGFDNIQNELNTCYQLNYDSDFYLENNYNTHNYFLYILIGSGVIGLLLFLYSLGYIIKLAIESNNLLFFILLLNVFIVCCVENFLYRVQGLLFFYWFLCVFVLKSNKNS